MTSTEQILLNGRPAPLVTVRGVGYMFSAVVDRR